jgi:hypothetical protein
MTARGSATAGRTTATIAQTPKAPDQREIELQASIAVMVNPELTNPPAFEQAKAAFS